MSQSQKRQAGADNSTVEAIARILCESFDVAEGIAEAVARQIVSEVPLSGAGTN